MENLYSALLESTYHSIADSPNRSYAAITERHMQAIWFGQKYFNGLKTANGDPITVISPGLWNGEAGPDFKKAHLKIGSQEIKGDIELHLSEEGWTGHRHHLDPRYNEVVLHLSLWQPKQPREILNSQGTKIVQAWLEPFLDISITQIVKLIDLDLYPYKAHIGSGKCSQSLFKDLSLEATKKLFINAADWRLNRKFLKLETHALTNSPDELLKIGTAMALGYKNNTKEFLQTYLFLRNLSSSSEQELFAQALQFCGFFSSRYHEIWKDSHYYLQLYNLCNEKERGEGTNLTLHQIRPFNHPIRRLAYLSKIMHDPSWDAICTDMIKIWNDRWDKITKQKDWNELKIIWEEAIPSYQDSFWNFHYTFISKSSTKPLSFLGSSIKMEIIINSFMPILYSIIINRSYKEIEAFKKLYSSFSASNSGKSKYLSHRYFGEINNKQILNSAYCEQGAYQIHHDFCIHFEASCEGCPFVNRYKTIFQYS